MFRFLRRQVWYLAIVALAPLVACARLVPAQNPSDDPELTADRQRWATLRIDPDSVSKSTADPYPALFTTRRMTAAQACGISGFVWRMPDMLRVMFVQDASSAAKRDAAGKVGARFLFQTGADTYVLWLFPTRACAATDAAAQLRTLPAIALVSTIDLAAAR